MIGAFHSVWGWVVIWVDLAAGLYGIGLAVFRRSPGAWFRFALGTAVGASLLQVAAGLVMYGAGERPGGFHLFYGVLILIAVSFGYVYRTEMNKKSPALRWGLFALFLMGLGLRAITTFQG